MKTNENVTSEITGNKLTVSQLCFPTYTFEIKEKAPAGYHVWNIGNNMPNEYTPYCKYLHDLNIDSTNLVAVKNKHYDN